VGRVFGVLSDELTDNPRQSGSSDGNLGDRAQPTPQESARCRA